MNSPELISARWHIDEFLFLEFKRDAWVILDVGPFPQEPEVAELDQAYAYLEKARLDYLELHDINWTLDTKKLFARYPDWAGESVDPVLSHPAAFEIARMPGTPDYLLNAAPAPAIGYVLRLTFEFHPIADPFDESQPDPESIEPREEERPLDPPTEYPKIIS